MRRLRLALLRLMVRQLNLVLRQLSLVWHHLSLVWRQLSLVLDRLLRLVKLMHHAWDCGFDLKKLLMLLMLLMSWLHMLVSKPLFRLIGA